MIVHCILLCLICERFARIASFDTVAVEGDRACPISWVQLAKEKQQAQFSHQDMRVHASSIALLQQLLIVLSQIADAPRFTEEIGHCTRQHTS